MPPSALTSTDPLPLALAAPCRAPWCERLVLRALAALPRGHLRVELPDGRVHEYGTRDALATTLPQGVAAHAVLRVHSPRFFRRCLAYGDVGFAEAFIDGDWSSPDLTALIGWFIQNSDQAPTLAGSRRQRLFPFNLFALVNRLRHLARGHSRRAAARHIHDHYDLSNAFFALFLDPSMMYSAALWEHPTQSLEEAQRAKNERLCRLLRLQPTDHVLEIGTGWGGWALHAAQQHGCRVTTLTLSAEQAKVARDRIAAAGLTDRVDVKYQDFRDVEGSYDKLVSIEMMEALGHRLLPEFCSTINRVLRPQGLAALQFITCPDARYPQLRRGVDFIQKHIFPGSLLLAPNRVNALMARHGGWVLHHLHDLGADYARTLACWQDTFASRREEVQRLGFNDAFVRKWNYYLSYCRAAFALRHISVVQTLYTRPDNLAL